jgi:hypothetical protein
MSDEGMAPVPLKRHALLPRGDWAKESRTG